MSKNKKILKEILTWVGMVLIAFVLSFFVNSKAYASVIVHQSSMENTLFNNQRLVVDELSYDFAKPHRGDIVTFYPYETKGSIIDDFHRYIDKVVYKSEHERLIKRVIGVEGDVIDIKDGEVYVNGNKLEEPYVKGETTSKGLKTPLTVGKNEIFVLGDNRVVSIDSRELGLVKLNQVEGKAIYRVYPFDVMGKIK